MNENEVLARVLRRLLSDPKVTSGIVDGQLVVHGVVKLGPEELGALPNFVGNTSIAQRVDDLHAKILSLRRTAEHLRADSSTRWTRDARRLEDRADQHQAEVERLISKKHP